MNSKDIKMRSTKRNRISTDTKETERKKLDRQTETHTEKQQRKPHATHILKPVARTPFRKKSQT